MEEVISEATAVEVLATWSTPDELLPRMARVVGRVRGHAVRAAETVTGPAVGEIAAALRAVLDARDLAPGCFSPRHALRFRSPTDEVVFVICFECILVLGFWRDAACSINLTRERASFEMRLRAAGVGVDFGA